MNKQDLKFIKALYANMQLDEETPDNPEDEKDSKNL